MLDEKDGVLERAEALMIAAWPEPAEYAKFIDEDAERSFELLRSVVSAARSTRARYRLSPKEQLVALARMGVEDQQRFSTMTDLAASLGNLELTVAGEDAAKPAASIGVVDGGVEVFIVLEGKVDLAAERARMEKEVASATKELTAAERTLANEGFVAKAAPEVVQKKRDRAAELKETITALQSQLADFE